MPYVARKKAFIFIVCLAILTAAIILVSQIFRPETAEGLKAITVEITHRDGTGKTVSISTEAEFLRGALEEEDLIAGTESAFGLFITAVDGYTADESKQEWWGYTRGGEYVETGVDATPIYDGEVYEFTLNTGW